MKTLVKNLAAGPGALRRHFDQWVFSRPWLYRFIVCLVACIVLMVFVDLPVAIFLRESAFQASMPVWETIETFGQAQGYVVLAILGYAGFLHAARRLKRRVELSNWCRDQARYFLLFFLTIGSSAVIVHAIKAIVGRLRPSAFFGQHEIGFYFNFLHNPYDSFPSGHTHTAFAVAACLAIWKPAYRWPFFLLAGLIGFSRLVQSAHWASDVAMGAFISIACAYYLAPKVLDPTRRWPGRPPWEWFSKS